MLYSPLPDHIATIARLLKQGEVVAVPTETVYGLAAHALDESACRRVFEIKGRPLDDPLIVHIGKHYPAERLAHWNAAAEVLASSFWPGPLTMVLPKTHTVPDLVTAGKKSVGLRMPAHNILQTLLHLSEIPLAAPSANPFGGISPTSAEQVKSLLGRRIEAILDGGPCHVGVESTIVDLRTPSEPRLLRPGGLPAEWIEEVLHRPLLDAGPQDTERFPGQFTRHYSPRKPLRLVDAIDPADTLKHREHAFLFFRKPRFETGLPPNVFYFSETGDLDDAARNLFAVLHRADMSSFERIISEKVPDRNIGKAINNRLMRAAHP